MATAVRIHDTLMSPGMAKAYRLGRKWQTRRVVKIEHQCFDFIALDNCDPPQWWTWRGERDESAEPWERIRCPYGQPGDELRFLTTWSAPKEFDNLKPTALQEGVRLWSYFESDDKPEWCGRFRPGRFLPKRLRALMPRTPITDVRVQRLRAISEEDAIAEGFTTVTYRDGRGQESARHGFKSTWERLNSKRGYPWSSNPFVFAISFQRIEG